MSDFEPLYPSGPRRPNIALGILGVGLLGSLIYQLTAVPATSEVPKTISIPGSMGRVALYDQPVNSADKQLIAEIPGDGQPVPVTCALTDDGFAFFPQVNAGTSSLRVVWHDPNTSQPVVGYVRPSDDMQYTGSIPNC